MKRKLERVVWVLTMSAVFVTFCMMATRTPGAPYAYAVTLVLGTVELLLMTPSRPPSGDSPAVQ